MPVLKIKTDDGWKELGGTSPADGGNADTLDGKHADEFALASDVNAPKTELILNSSTEGSTKKFKITIDDEGVLTATEIIESGA